ncbi:rhamnulose-1-phosphate aldolase [candidate division KSB1 bacterium]|nr:MAG: rhamnulose-1-phosphate aldolase [candidate division KSB1 bacterium]
MEKLINGNRELQNVIDEISEIAGYLWDRGWAEKNAGNISVNITSLINDSLPDISSSPMLDLAEPSPYIGGMFFLISAAGSLMRNLNKRPLDNMVVIRVANNGAAYQILSVNNDSVPLVPSSELPTHFAVHQLLKIRNSTKKAVIHSHVDELIALTQIQQYKNEEEINRILWGMHPESMIVIPQGVGFVPYKLTGSVDLAQATLEKMAGHDIVLWEKHGVLSSGESVSQAFDYIDIAAKSVRIFFMCKASGFEPEGLTDKQIEELKGMIS